MNPLYTSLCTPYPFQKLARLLEGLSAKTRKAPYQIKPLASHNTKHQPLCFDTLAKSLVVLQIPKHQGRVYVKKCYEANGQYSLKLDNLDPRHRDLASNWDSEALSAITQTLVGENRKLAVVSPNPFYRKFVTWRVSGIPERLGCKTLLMFCCELLMWPPTVRNYKQGWLPARWRIVSGSVAKCCSFCSPNNPSWAHQLLDIRRIRLFIEKPNTSTIPIVRDECYSEIYFGDQASYLGLLWAWPKILRTHKIIITCLIFQSLSKRSNLTGLRSGFGGLSGDGIYIETLF